MSVSLLLLGLLQPVPQDSAPEVTALVGATVLPMDGERRLEDHTLVVEGQRIVALGPDATTEVPSGARVIDAKGGFVMPGLVDMHVHTWGAADHALFLASGVTTVRNLFGSPMHLALRARAAAGEVLAPSLVTAGPIVDGDPPVWLGSLVVTTAERAREVVGEHHEQGYDFVKVYNGLSREAYDALLEEAALADLPVDGHVPDAVGYERALAAGQRTIEHMSGLGLVLAAPGSVATGGWMGDLLGWQHVDEERAAEWTRRTVEAGAWLCPTLVVFQKMLEPEDFEREITSEAVRHVPVFVRSLWRNMRASSTPEFRGASRASLPGRMRFLKRFVDAGGNLILGTDMGNPLVVAGRSVHEELANLVAAGLSPYQALRAATRAPAECLGQEREFGSLAPGRRADLLLLDADPLEDVAHAREPAAVMLRGRWLERDELERLLQELLTTDPASGR